MKHYNANLKMPRCSFDILMATNTTKPDLVWYSMSGKKTRCYHLAEVIILTPTPILYFTSFSTEQGDLPYCLLVLRDRMQME